MLFYLNQKENRLGFLLTNLLLQFDPSYEIITLVFCLFVCLFVCVCFLFVCAHVLLYLFVRVGRISRGVGIFLNFLSIESHKDPGGRSQGA